MKSAPSNLLKYKISRKNKIGEICNQRPFYFGIFGVEFQKTIVIFQIRTFKFNLFQNFAKKQTSPNLGTKMPYLDIFGLHFKKTDVIFEISTTKFVKL